MQAPTLSACPTPSGRAFERGVGSLGNPVRICNFMPRLFVIILILTPLAIGGAMLWQKNCHSSVSNAPLTQRVYVWQRIQNVPAVASAVEKVPRDVISGVLPLVAEIHFRMGADSPPEIIRPALAIESFQKREAAGNADAVVIRIGVSAAETGWSPAACERVSSLAREFLSSPIWL
jgi:hypothetical protein